jgi:hypothetical protein
MELTYQTLQHGTQGQSTLRKLQDVQRKRGLKSVGHRLHG